MFRLDLSACVNVHTCVWLWCSRSCDRLVLYRERRMAYSVHRLVGDIGATEGLKVVAKGLGMHLVLLQFVAQHHSPSQLVLVLNLSAAEERCLQHGLAVANCAPPVRITNECTARERVELYLAGGVILVTTQILVVDLLSHRVPTQQVTGLLVANAHRVHDRSNVAFAVRIFRQENESGFIKAFSDDAHGFTHGFARAEKAMCLLRVHRLQLWPRFRCEVNRMLQGCQPEVEEVGVRLSQRASQLQRALLQAVDSCLQELRSLNGSAIDVSSFTVENSLFKSFDTIVRMQLNPFWHKTSKRTQSLANDLQTLRKLLYFLVSLDCVSFFEYLETVFDAASALHPAERPAWMLNHSETVFLLARERVYEVVRPPSGQARLFGLEPSNTSERHGERPLDVRCVLEPCLKWLALFDLLAEVQREEGACGSCLVVVRDEHTAATVRELLVRGAKSLLETSFVKWVRRRRRSTAVVLSAGAVLSARQHEARLLGAAAAKLSDERQGGHRVDDLDLRDCVLPEHAGVGGGGVVTPGAPPTTTQWQGSAESIGTFFELLPDLEHSTFVCTFEAVAMDVLDDLRPQHVVLYDSEAAFVRAVEIAQAARPMTRMHVYFVIQLESVEEQRYRSSLRVEREAFQSLIMNKGSMAIPSKWEPASSQHYEDVSSLGNQATRRGGGRALEAVGTPTVVVDMREFRSSLPNMLHLHGMAVRPTTLEVGDYVLSPEVCVERKAVSDLIQSLASGRLYSQAGSMLRYYKRPALLLEMEEGRPFGIVNPNELGAEISTLSVLSKLSLLMLHFPTLRLLWSRSAAHTVAIFSALKQEQPEPDVAVAAGVGMPTAAGAEETFNIAPQDVLRQLPGVHVHNCRQLMNSVLNLRELATKSRDELASVIGAQNGKLLHEFLHRSI